MQVYCGDQEAAVLENSGMMVQMLLLCGNTCQLNEDYRLFESGKSNIY
jgi:hypothetical protein